MHVGLLWILLHAVGAAPAGPPRAAPDTVVVCPRGLVAPLRPWMAYRTRQGHRLALVTDAASPETIRRAVRQAAKGGKLRFVLLVGDAEPPKAAGERSAALCTPTYMAKAKVDVRWGSEPEIATDNYYADLDDDQVPDLAVGRLTADSPKEVADAVRKILAYEQGDGFGLWRRRVHFVAGIGGFGMVADSLLETAAKRFITAGIPAAYETSMTYAGWRSPYCPDPRQFRDIAVGRLNEGSLFWVYVGHGQRRSLDRVRIGATSYPILEARDAAKLDAAAGPAIAVFLSCYAGAFDGEEDCLAEEMLRASGGPVAVVCGSRVTMPYAMSVMGVEMLKQVFVEHRETIGEVLLYAKRSMVAGDEGNADRRLLDALAAAISPTPNELAAERAEHLLLFNLLGDPLLKLRLGQAVKVETAGSVTAGEPLNVAGVSPVDGRCTVELVCRRDRLTFNAPARRRFARTNAALSSLTKTYKRANDHRWAAATLSVEGGRLQTPLDVPRQARGPCHVRVFVQGRADFALGEADVYVRRPEPETPAGQR